jgi:hypothetical protein
MFIFFLFFAKMFLLKVVHPLKIYQNINFHDPRQPDAVLHLHSPQKFESPPFWNGCSYSIKMASISPLMAWPPTEFQENLPTGSEFDRGESRHRQDSDLISACIFPLRSNSRLVFVAKVVIVSVVVKTLFRSLPIVSEHKTSKTLRASHFILSLRQLVMVNHWRMS